MNDDLYFIPIIIEAFKQPDKSSALKKAFEQIEQLGKLDRYSQGWRQFCLFMNETLVSADNYSADQLQEKLINIFKRPEVFDITIEKNGIPIETLSFKYSGDSKTAKNIIPGSYKLIFESGLCIWQGTVNAEDVLQAGLKMAADDTGKEKRKPTKTVPLFSQAGEINFYASIGSGSMEIVIKKIRI